MKKAKEIVVFTLRRDNKTQKNEGEYYTVDKIQQGIVNVNHYSSPQLSDHQTYICIGQRAIKDGFERYEHWIGHKTSITYQDVIREINRFCKKNKIQPVEVRLHDENKLVWKVSAQMFFAMHCNQVKKHLFETFNNTNLDLKVPPPLNNTMIFTIKKKK